MSGFRFIDWVVQLVDVIGSTLDGPHNAVLMGGNTVVGSLDPTEPDDEAPNDATDEAPAYGAPGIVFRPRPPEEVETDAGTELLSAEAVAARVADTLIPVAWRDLRLNRRFVAPKAGTVALVGYGGGFLSFDDGSTEGTLQTLYCPYDFDADGVAQKTHAILVQPDGANGISINHGDGYQLSLTSGGFLLRCSDANTFLQVKEGQIVMSAAKIFAKGTLYVGQAGELGVPLLPGPASPPCPSLFLSPS